MTTARTYGPLGLVIALVALVLGGCTTPSNSTSHRAHSDPRYVDSSYPPAIVELNFSSHGKRLNGILYQANGAGPHPTVVLLHGYPGNEKNLDLAQSMRRSGYNVLFFHYRGAWGSDGLFSYSHVIEDVASATSFLRARRSEYRVDADRLLLIGHSMGGFAALQGAAADDNIKCVAGIAPANVGLIARAIETDPGIAKRVATGANALTMLKGWTGEVALADIKANAKRFDIPGLANKLSGKSVLLVAGDKDTVITPEAHHKPAVAAFLAQGDIELTHTIISGDHSFSWSRYELTDTVLDWAQGCVTTYP